MYLQDITPELLEKLKKQLKNIESNIEKNICDYWNTRNNNCTEHKGVYINAHRNWLMFRCSRHRGFSKKLSQKEVFYLKCL